MTPKILTSIKQIPNLYISDRQGACDEPLLVEHGITHILTIRRWEDDPNLAMTPITPPIKLPLIRKYVELEDDPTADLLAHLGEMVDWIHDALSHKFDPKPRTETITGSVPVPPVQNAGSRVLVHCNQGISRSGAVIIAYMMRTLEVDYKTALSMAQQSRILISPNFGFQYQLRLWRQCGFDVYDPADNEEQERKQGGGNSLLRPNATYRAWKNEVAEIFDSSEGCVFQRAKEEWLGGLQAKLDAMG
ncbi:protein-tyrosine phosphatase-like protein [Aspergillus cavernicola]|uniref:protein-tyrosine-phosphatase n=1 Tax=Aspergillus cavernicola TaxID=176166 RepID=A0ABR4HSF6_9EURO